MAEADKERGQSSGYNALQATIIPEIQRSVRSANELAKQDIPFHRSLEPEIDQRVSEQGDRLLSLTQRLLEKAIPTFGANIPTPQLKSLDDVENKWREIVDVADGVLEKADIFLDEVTGVVKRDVNNATEIKTPAKAKKNKDFWKMQSQQRKLNVVKPQLLFDEKVDNHSTTPFKPLLVTKPHAIIPLNDSLRTFTNIAGHEVYYHPYGQEIYSYEYPPSVYTENQVIPSLPYETTAATFVDTLEGVQEMLEELRHAEEIAVDLEHHDTRTYVGIVCLMQISTRKKDWVVDTLRPWRLKLQVLNEVFADPKIVKVFHGAFMDIIWLQRDLGLYVVGLFDTFHAARGLGYPQASLASLLERFTDFRTDKKYQLADWRIRPLPDEMFSYARSDTHFLLYIYDRMRNELVEKTRIKGDQDYTRVVLYASKDTALQIYERSVYDEEGGSGAMGWLYMLRRLPMYLSSQQVAVFRAVHRFRDCVARDEDESLFYIMSKPVLLAIARAMPTDVQSLNQGNTLSDPIKSRAMELIQVIQEAKVAGVNGPSMGSLLPPADDALVAETNGQASSRLSATKGVSTTQRSDGVAHDLQKDLTQLQLSESLLWRDSFGSSYWDHSQKGSDSFAVERFAVPLPPLTAEIFENAGPQADLAIPLTQMPPEHEYIPSRERKRIAEQPSNVFVVRELGGGRNKRTTAADAAPSEGPADGGEERVAGDHEEMDMDMDMGEEGAAEKQAAEGKAEAKRVAKAARKEEKERRKAARANGDQAEGEAESGEAFNYEEAPSMLHAKKVDAERGGVKKVFDPYIKSMDAPKGLKKARSERAGKSMTFGK